MKFFVFDSHFASATVQSNNDDKLKGMLEQLPLTISIPLTIYMMLAVIYGNLSLKILKDYRRE
jgi:hypothetical protein